MGIITVGKRAFIVVSESGQFPRTNSPLAVPTPAGIRNNPRLTRNDKMHIDNSSSSENILYNNSQKAFARLILSRSLGPPVLLCQRGDRFPLRARLLFFLSFQ